MPSPTKKPVEQRRPRDMKEPTPIHPSDAQKIFEAMPYPRTIVAFARLLKENGTPVSEYTCQKWIKNGFVRRDRFNTSTAVVAAVNSLINKQGPILQKLKKEDVHYDVTVDRALLSRLKHCKPEELMGETTQMLGVLITAAMSAVSKNVDALAIHDPSGLSEIMTAASKATLLFNEAHRPLIDLKERSLKFDQNTKQERKGQKPEVVANPNDPRAAILATFGYEHKPKTGQH